ncbi:MAG: hypothetical protein MJ193_02250 [Clostridia bacterium]|nr:hypothetical protein [Clostridia bacterium]
MTHKTAATSPFAASFMPTEAYLLLPLLAFFVYNINMSKIEIYSADYDSNQNVYGDGMNGKVFVTVDNVQHECKTVNDAFDGLNFAELNEIDLYYQKNGVQYFKKLMLQLSSGA